MGTWVERYKITLVTPRNNAEEILRIIVALSPQFEQKVILGYPPFVKGVVDLGNVGDFHMRFVFAGEVFSEERRALVEQRAGVRDPMVDIVSIYGTVDAGVLANVTPLSARIIDLVKTPGYYVLAEYERDTAATPLLPPVRSLPFVWDFGRAFWTVSLYGPNVYVENIMVGLEQEFIHRFVTRKFVLMNEDPDGTRLLRIELAPNIEPDETKQPAVAHSVLTQLMRLNGEYANYVPAKPNRVGVKNSYI
ncbi:hypothetical protein BJ742DRAFT_735408 [Cladochytrium replicatum]|nr:hypothetical protein BJ742DRAFT_735408 [Cladochytrium replicatum]